MKIDFFHEKEKAKKIKQKLFNSLNLILKSGQYTNGFYVKKFENNFKKFIDAKYCVAVNTGTSALHIALASLDINKNDEVIVPSITFVASAAAIRYLGAKPVFVDVNEKDWLLDVNKIEKIITKKTKAIIAVHLHGLMCDMKAIKKIANKFNLFIIEDAAQAHGSEYFNKKPGYFSDIAIFSFYPTKNLGAIGEGGAIITNNKKLFHRSVNLRTWATTKSSFSEIGYNYRMPEFIASSLNIKLKFLNRDIKKRIKIANYYKKAIVLKNFSYFDSLIKKHSYHIFALKIKKRDEFMLELNKKKIDTATHYSYCLPMLHIFGKNKKKLSDIFFSGINVSKQIVSLPIYPELQKHELEYIVSIVNKTISKLE